MATTSFPAAGNGGLSVTTWSQMYLCPDGVVNDVAGTGLKATPITASNIIRISAGMAAVNGYYLLNDADFDLTVPTAAGIYFVVVSYDPALNVADGSGNAVPAGPCRLALVTTLDTSGGKAYTMLLRIARDANQSLAAATITKYAQNIGPNLSVDVMPPAKLTNPEGAYGGWDHPLGAVAFERSTGETYRKTLNSSGGTYWQRSSFSGPTDFPNPSALVTANSGEQARYWVSNNGAVVHFEGTLKRSNGASLSNGSDVLLGTMPKALWPVVQTRFPCVAKPPSGWATVQITVKSSTGEVFMYDPTGFEVDWVDLSGISYRIR